MKTREEIAKRVAILIGDYSFSGNEKMAQVYNAKRYKIADWHLSQIEQAKRGPGWEY